MFMNIVAPIFPAPVLRQEAGNQILEAVLKIPTSNETRVEAAQARAQALGRIAARQAALIAGSLALPPGILGWLTVMPELVGV